MLWQKLDVSKSLILRIYKAYTHFTELKSDLTSLKDRFNMGSGHFQMNLPSAPTYPSFPIDANNQEFLQLGHNLANTIQQVVTTTTDESKLKHFLNWLGISRPFCSMKYDKITEFACEKQSQGKMNDNWFMRNAKSIFRRWQDRWVVITAHTVSYYGTADWKPTAVKDFVPFDVDTKVILKEHTNKSMNIEFELPRRTLTIRIKDAMNGFINLHNIVKIFRRNKYAVPQRFGSFAPQRKGNDCTFFHDGEGYFFELSKSLEVAKSEIMITDWWFSPEMPLVRPAENGFDGDFTRIDRTLQRAAQRGVKVYVVVYKEFAMSMNNDSEHTKLALEKLHPNIKVLRHPNVVVSLWSHHEKMVCIDRSTVFMGGLDICWGRFDYPEHPLFNDPKNSQFPGADYYNPLKKDIAKGREYQKSPIDPNYPRMPWHDIAVKLKGPICQDYAYHFTTYWNHARETNSESEVLLSKRVAIKGGERQELNAAREDLAVAPAGVQEGDSFDPYEYNSGTTTQNMANLIQNDYQVDENYFAPQDNLFNLLQGQTSLNDGMAQMLKAEQDKQALMTADHRQLTNAESSLDAVFGETKHQSLDELMKPLVSAFSNVGNLSQSFPQTSQGAPQNLPGQLNSFDCLSQPQQPGPVSTTLTNSLPPGFEQAVGGQNPNPQQGALPPDFLQSMTDNNQNQNQAFPIQNNTAPEANPFNLFSCTNADDDPLPALPLITNNQVNPIVQEPFNPTYNGMDDNSIQAPQLISQIFDHQAGGQTEFDPDKYEGDIKMQALRSSSHWSLGKRNTECSIYNCYLSLIENAEHYIYIENQFFISDTSETGVQNRIAKALYCRALRAYNEGKPFKIIVFMPLMPAFEANLENNQGNVMQIQIALQNRTIGKGSNSLIERLTQLFQGNRQVSDYLMFCALRKWERRPSDGKPITELIYIHSKVSQDYTAHDHR